MGNTTLGHQAKRQTVLLCTAGLVTVLSGPAFAGHQFTQNPSVGNTPTWIQEGQGIRIDQGSMEPNDPLWGSSPGLIEMYFAANSSVPDGADTSDSTWWSWSAGDVLRFTVPTADGTLSTTIAHDTDAACAYDLCGITGSSSIRTSLPAIGATNLSLGSSEVSTATPVVWTVESLAGQFSLDGYRVYFPNGTLNGTGAGPLNQTSVVDSGDLGGGGATPDIDTAKGTYLLSELNAGTVNTNFAGGILTVDIDADVAANFIVGATGGTIDTAGHAAHFAGQFSGDGGLTKSGTGALALSGVNTQAGGTTVTGGTVIVAANESLGALPAALTLDGGTLSANAGFSLDRQLQIGSAGGALQTGAAPVTVAGPITGAGTLTIAGNIEIGAAAHAHTGTVTLSGGTLLLNGALPSSHLMTGAGTLFGGSGSFAGAVEVAGELSPGNSPGTLTFGSDATLASTTVSRFEIDGRVHDPVGGAGSYDRVVLTGADAVFTADGTVVPVLRGITGSATNTFTPVIGDAFRIVTTANDAGIAGAFDELAQPAEGLSAGQRFAVLYGSDYIDLVVAPTTFLAFAKEIGNDNAVTAAEAFDRLAVADAAEARPLLYGLYGLDPARLAVALTESSGEIHAFALDAVRGGLAGSAQALGTTVAGRRTDEPFWLDARGAWSDLGATDAASSREESGGHLLVGHDLYRSGPVRAGLAFGVARQTVETSFDAEADATTYLVAGYAAAEHSGFVFDAMLGAARSSLRTDRDVTLSTGGQSVEGEGDVRSLVAGLGASYRHDLGYGLSGRAWSRLVATSMHADAYDETGSDDVALDVEDTRQGNTVASLGYEIGGSFDAGRWHLGLGLEQAAGRTERPVALFGEGWDVAASDHGVTRFATAGVTLHSTRRSTLSLEVGLRDGDDRTSRSVAATYGLTW